MVFGELVEPSSRSLWDDELAEIEDDETRARPALQWSGAYKIPSKIDRILIGESSRICSFLYKCFLDSKKLLCHCNEAGIQVYSLGNESYIILYKKVADIIVGEVTEFLSPWLKAAHNVYSLTSAPLPLLVNYKTDSDGPCIIRCLTTEKTKSSYLKLEVPNLVTGLVASVLTYCICQELACTLFIGYFDEVPLDSMSVQPLITLMNHLRFTPIKEFVSEVNLPSHNLYM